jgi:hypothetical protein
VKARALLALLVVAAAGAAPGRVPASAAPARGDPAARLLPHEHASDFWDLTIELEGGAWIVAQATISNLGPGDRTGGVVGHVLAPDGTAHEFHKIRRDGAWQLSAAGRRLDLGAIVLDLSGPEVRLSVDKKRVDMDLRIELGGGRAWPERLTWADGAEHGFDLLALAAPAAGTLRFGDGPPTRVTGRAVLTHRWTSVLEAELMERRIELFALQGDAGLYFTELAVAGQPPRRWLVLGQGGRILASHEDVEASFQPGGGAAGPDRLRIDSASARGGAELARVLLRDEPLGRAPWPIRVWIERLTRPRFVWSAAPFEFTVREAGGGERRFSGKGLVDVARFDAGGPLPAARWGER